jgi:hypothetical protein
MRARARIFVLAAVRRVVPTHEEQTMRRTSICRLIDGALRHHYARGGIGLPMRAVVGCFLSKTGGSAEM